MHEEQQITHQSPFDHGLFFPDSGHRSTLEALKNAVASHASLITCIGEEGHGKTMLCKKLEQAFPEPYLVISFPYSVESFDYVLQIIALKLNLDFSLEDNALGSGHLLMEIARTLREQEKRLLILFDEAEKLYLATLERVRKMIDLVNEEKVLLQIILFGRTGLQAHIEQLALCTFKNAQEIHLTLPPLTEEDAFQYLNFCMQQRPGSEKKNIFSREVAAKILAVSHGNFRKINSLAEDSLRSSSYNADNTSFMVLLEHVKDTDELVAEEFSARRLPSLLMQRKIAFGTGVLLLSLFLFLFVNRETKNPSPPPIAQKGSIQKKPQPTKPAQKEPITTTIRPALIAAAEPVTKPVQPVPAATPAPNVQQPAPPAPVAQDMPAPAQSSVQALPAAPATQAVTPVTTASATQPAPPSPMAATEPTTTPPQPTPQAITEPTPKPVSVEIAPLVEEKSSDVHIVVADKLPKKNTIPLLTPEPVTKNKELLSRKKELKPNISHQLPRKSLAAGDKWLAGEKNDLYTLQLMVLADDLAGEKLKELLHNEEQQGAENFIVLKKSTSPATFILFYGEYPTITAARDARNNLPPSLQKYTPYPVSVKQAVEKSKR